MKMHSTAEALTPNRARAVAQLSLAIVVATTIELTLPARADDALRCAVSCEAWRSVYSGPGGGDFGRALAVGPGRVYVTGESDAGPGSDMVDDIGTVAYEAATGAQMWVARYDGPGDGPTTGGDGGRSVAVSLDGQRVFATGESPGVGTFQDFATIGYDATSGAQLWAARYNGPPSGDDFARTVVVSPDGSTAYVGGYSETGLPGNAEYNYASVAYDAATGAQLWASRYDGPGVRDVLRTLTLSPDGGRIYVTGHSWRADASPDFTTVAYDAATGKELWVARYDGPAGDWDDGWALATSPDGARLYVGGWSTGVGTGSDFATVAYDAATGQQLWVARYDGEQAKDELTVLSVSPDGSRVFVAGESSSTSNGPDFLTVAYEAATGAQVWAARYTTAENEEDVVKGIDVSPGGHRLYVTGWSKTATTDYDVATVAYQADTGQQIWVARHDSPGHILDAGQGISAKPDGSVVYVAGYGSEISGRDYITIAYRITDPPTATLTADGTSGPPPLQVTFHLDARDPDAPLGSTLASWSLDVDGDGMPDYGREGAPPSTLTHTYQTRGTFRALLTVSDDHGAIGVDEVVITVENRAPVAVDDSATTVNGIRVTINVLANDSDPDGDSLTVTGVTQPPHGTAVINPNQTVTYDPDCAFQGTETFTYTIDDGSGGADTAFVSVRVRKTSRRGSIPC